MTRLFIRFYLGVILILCGAWALQACAFRYFSPPQNKRAFDDVFTGGLRLARQIYLNSDESDASLQSLRDQFGYPVKVVSLSSLPEEDRSEIASGADSVLYQDDGFFSATPLPDSAHVLRFGP